MRHLFRRSQTTGEGREMGYQYQYIFLKRCKKILNYKRRIQANEKL